MQLCGLQPASANRTVCQSWGI